MASEWHACAIEVGGLSSATTSKALLATEEFDVSGWLKKAQRNTPRTIRGQRTHVLQSPRRRGEELPRTLDGSGPASLEGLCGTVAKNYVPVRPDHLEPRPAFARYQFGGDRG
eukprot:1003085-Amphidinium_carterae.1